MPGRYQKYCCVESISRVVLKCLRIVKSVKKIVLTKAFDKLLTLYNIHSIKLDGKRDAYISTAFATKDLESMKNSLKNIYTFS